MIEQEIESLCKKIENASFDDHDALYEKVIAIAKKAGRGLQVGKILRFGVADGHALYFVTKVNKASVNVRHIALWDQYAFAGIIQKGGGNGSINRGIAEQAVRWDDMMDDVRDESAAFYDCLQPGALVHYSNGHNTYVRCQVMPDKQLMPIALVGEWRTYDLPKRNNDGSVYLGYHAQSIVDKKTFQPHASNVYEYNITKTQNSQPIGFSKWTDPLSLAAISLDVPPMTEEQKMTAAYWQRIQVIQGLLNDIRDPAETLWAIHEVLSGETKNI